MNIDTPWVKENFIELARTLAKTDDSALIESFLRSLLTPAETVDIAARWALVKALKDNIPQREIASQFGISLCKITRGSRELKKLHSPFEQMLAISKKL
ncbi:MAG: trp operon repressor [Treponema sp.]|jgi:TrpR family trp operon transcriptional repressor|nr:trp operon repressor [Treponema sp.]